MITQGSLCTEKKDMREISRLTVWVLRDTAPVNLGGIFFLSGGQGEIEATQCLNLINIENQKFRSSWSLSFSFGWALQNTVVKTWAGKKENTKEA